MKKQLLLVAITLCYSLFGYSQNDKVNTLDNMGITMAGRNYDIKSGTQGSPYLNATFLHAKVGETVQNALMRYNAYRDQFEFIDSKRDTLALNKTEAFSNITFTGLNLNYQLVTYTEKSGLMNTGYLIRVHEKNGNVLYKRQKVNFYQAVIAKSSYDSNTPARYSPAKDTYFLKNKDNQVSELPTNKKGFLKLYPEKKTELEAFIKQNDIDVEKEQDLIRLIDFLSA